MSPKRATPRPEREQLERIIARELDKSGYTVGSLADAILADGWARVPSPPPTGPTVDLTIPGEGPWHIYCGEIHGPDDQWLFIAPERDRIAVCAALNWVSRSSSPQTPEEK